MYIDITAGQHNPIEGLWNKDRDLERLPEHVQHVLTTPPAGHADMTRWDTLNRPSTNGAFTGTLPLSANEVDEYIGNAYFPYTKCQVRREAVKYRVQRVGDYLAAYGSLGFVVLTLALSITTSFAWRNTALCTVSVGLLLISLPVAACIEPKRPRRRIRGSCSTTPTQRMKDIERRSVNITPLGSHINEYAWSMYLYDRACYDQFVALCVSMLDVDAAPSSETHHTRREILDTFNAMSRMRQAETQRLLDDKWRDAKDRQQQRQDDIDAVQAEVLRKMMLEPLEADLRAMKKVYERDT